MKISYQLKARKVITALTSIATLYFAFIHKGL